MRTTNRFLPLVLIGMTFVSAPAAGQYYWPENKPGTPGAMATYVYIASAYLPANVTHTWETRNVSSGGDTVMHLTRGNLTTEVAYNDDCPGSGSLRSCFTYRTTVAATYFLIVYAWSPDSGGRGGKFFDVYVDGLPYATHVRLGGYAISTAQGPLESMETVLVNDGAPATSIARLDWNSGVAHYQPAATDWTHGVGNGSKLWGSGGSSKWILATATLATREGPVRALRNDALLGDFDGDGLGDNLENALCTCRSRTAGSVCGFECSNVEDARDTDGDGIPDYWEAIGCESNSQDGASIPVQGQCTNWCPGCLNAQYLPLWGASPRHKDLFVEMDHYVGCSQLVGRTFAEFVAARFSAITGMNNPDGVDGIAAHFDLPASDLAVEPCNNDPGGVDVDGISKVCGNFGGAAVVDTNCDIWNPTIAAQRKKIFHWAEEDCNPGTSPVGGLTSCVGSRTSCTHELGHQLGLWHWGLDSAGKVNRKPNYPSLMNYAYQGKLNGSEENTAFSAGQRQPVDPASLSEASAYSPAADISFMLTAPYNFAELQAGSHWIDWNRDGYMSSAPVRALVTEQPGYEGTWDGNTGYDHPIMQEIENMPTSMAMLSPAAARATVSGTPYTYVVVHDDWTHRFKYTRSSQRVGGWSNPYVDIGSDTDTHRTDSQPALVNFDAWGGLILFGATNGDDQIHYTMMNSSGFWYPWSAALPNPPGVAFREVSATVLGAFLYVAARDDSTGNVYYGSFNSSLSFSGWTVATWNGTPIVSVAYTPGLAAGPDGRLYLGVKGAWGTPRPNRLDMYVFSGGSWSRSTALWGDSDDIVAGRPAMLWRNYVYADGTPLNTGTGALYIWYPAGSAPPPAPPGLHYRWTWGTFSATEQDFNWGRWHSPNLYREEPVCGDTTMNANSGVALVNRNDVLPDANLEVFVPHGPVADCQHHSNDTVHAPHADGEVAPTSGNPIADLNDYPVIAAQLCHGLGNPNVTCAGQGLRASEVHEVVVCNGIR